MLAGANSGCVAKISRPCNLLCKGCKPHYYRLWPKNYLQHDHIFLGGSMSGGFDSTGRIAILSCLALIFQPPSYFRPLPFRPTMIRLATREVPFALRYTPLSPKLRSLLELDTRFLPFCLRLHSNRFSRAKHSPRAV